MALITAAVAGSLAGVVATMALTSPTSPTAPAAASRHAREPAITTTTTAPPSAPVVARPAILLVWTSGGLPPGLAAQVAALDGVTSVATVRGDETAMTGSLDAAGRPVDVLADGWHVPLDTLAIEPASFAEFLDEDAAELVAGLGPGEALLTETSAALRRLATGATIRLTTGEVTVAGVIDDGSGAAAEVLVHADDAAVLDVNTERYLLVAHTGDRETLQRALATELLEGKSVRFRTPAETAWLRHGDAVEPPAVMKTAFGEFAVRDRPGRDIEIWPAWVERWIVTEAVPILGEVRCHSSVIESLRAAMAELEQADLAHLVDPGAYAGCYSPRRIGPGLPLSHHAWGAAVDLNVDGNPRGSFSTQDERLVETMLRHGWTWGGTWLVPDPAHYEAPVAADMDALGTDR
ncbi:MAG: M15 family metallopeptidase [Acidimicrobiales bacterium]